MPHFRFSIYDGVELLEETDVELRDAALARRAAIRHAGAALRATPDNVLCENWRLEVTNDLGLTMYQLDFAVTDSPLQSRAKASNGRNPPASKSASKTPS